MANTRWLSGAAGLAALVISCITPAAAQDVAHHQWQAWLGCWEAETETLTLVPDRQKPRICVIPSGPAAVEIATVVGDSVVLRQHIEATGEQRQVTRDGCTGWERAQWSANRQRVYLRSSFTCPSGLTRLSNGVMAMSAVGEWLDIQGVIAGSTKGVRVARYRDVTNLVSLPAEISTALKGRVTAINDARIIAMAPLTTEDVVEATRVIDPGVVQTWLAERGDDFGLDATKIVELEKAGVPTVVIDVMVALSYPNVFALDRSRVTGATRDVANENAAEGRTVYVYGWDPYYYSPYGYDRYGYRYGYGYGGGWYYGNRPVVIVRQGSNDNEAERHGRVVKGRGYVPGPRRESSGNGSAATSRGSSGSSGGSASGSSGSSSGSSTKSGSSGSGSGRTAKPRPPQ